MGICLNPGNSGFSDIRRDIYVDKTGLIAYVNNLIGKPKPLVCFSRPRRFGKTYDTHMLSAYYDKSCDSRSLFADLEIAGDDSFETHLNKYNVISIDVTTCISASKDTGRNVLEELKYSVLEEVREAFPECVGENENNLGKALCDVVAAGNAKFVFVIDEWDALFREYKDDTRLQEDYILFLRGLFKSKDVTPQDCRSRIYDGYIAHKEVWNRVCIIRFQGIFHGGAFRFSRVYWLYGGGGSEAL